MRIGCEILLATLLTTAACASEVDDVPAEGVVASAPLQASATCQSRIGELRDWAFWASIEIIEAIDALDRDPYNEASGRYFGLYADRATIRSTMLKAAQRARSTRLEFVCQSETHPDCSPSSTRVFWTTEGEHLRTDGWRIWVCGGRFWNKEWSGNEDAKNRASQLGIMVHELHHLGGAVKDSWTLDERALVEAAKEQLNRFTMPLAAEAYRFYVMNQ